MSLIAAYSKSDAYWTEEEVAEMKTEDPEGNEFLEPGYQDDVDEVYYDDFKYEMRTAFRKRKFPLVLVARKSNWRGQTGTAECSDVNSVLSKISSFDSDSIELHKGKGSKLWFKMGGTHDVPCGFQIDIVPINKAYQI